MIGTYKHRKAQNMNTKSIYILGFAFLLPFLLKAEDSYAAEDCSTTYCGCKFDTLEWHCNSTKGQACKGDGVIFGPNSCDTYCSPFTQEECDYRPATEASESSE